MDELKALFLSVESLQQILAYMCRSGSPDPISDSMRLMLSSPVHFHVSRFGLGLFKGVPVFPYTYMSNEQRTWLYDLMRAIRGDTNHSALSRLDDPLEYTTENDRIFFKDASMTRLEPKLVFDALIYSMTKSTHASPARLKLLVNLLLQRIGCRIQISRDTLTHVQSRTEALFCE